MGVLFDYFAAPDAAAAATVIEDGPADTFPTVSADGVDPVVLLGRAEELLGGRSFEQQLDDGRGGGPVEMRGGGELLVLAIDGRTRDRLAGAGEDELPAVARAWAEAEEFGGFADPGDLEQVLRELSALARGSVRAGHQMFCWVCV